MEAAVEIADARGIGAVSMAAVANSLGFTPMSLYRYVTAKDDLVLLMQEAGIGVPPETVLEAAADGWRAALERYADEMAFDVPAAPLAARHRDRGDAHDAEQPGLARHRARGDGTAAALRRRQGLDRAGPHRAGALAGALYRGYDAAATRTGSDTDALDWQAVAALEVLVTEEQFPRVHAALHAGVFSPQSTGDPFAVGRALVLDGVEALLAGRPLRAGGVGRPRDAAAHDPKVKEAAKARREVEKRLRDARAREREALKHARERLARRSG